MLRIDRKRDERVVHACTHNVADIPNGVTVASAELIPGVRLAEGTPIAPGSDGLYHVIKTAKVLDAVADTATTVNVAKGSHFKPGDVVLLKAGAKAVAITAIDASDPTKDVFTLKAAIGAVAQGAALVQAKAEGATGAIIYKAKALTGDSYDVVKLSNHLVSAVTIGQFKKAVIPAISDDILADLKGIVLI